MNKVLFLLMSSIIVLGILMATFSYFPPEDDLYKATPLEAFIFQKTFSGNPQLTNSDILYLKIVQENMKDGS